MKFIEKENSLLLVIDDDAERDSLWNYHNDHTIESDQAMYEFFEDILANCEWEWIDAEEIGALTSAPILGYRDENENVIAAYGFMNYCVDSVLVRLFIDEKVEFDKG